MLKIIILCLGVFALSHTSSMANSVTVKVAAASMNQTVYLFERNVKNICDAIDKAVEDGADVLSLPELSLTGYGADDYHQWNKTNDVVWSQIMYIANYAKKKNPNLIISVGAPWFFKDKKALPTDTLYNMNNRLFNTQILITGGKVVSITAKSILADGPGEYETRQFNAWPAFTTVIETLPDGSIVPFGKPVTGFGNKKKYITIYQEICAEGWPGINDDGTMNPYEIDARALKTLAKKITLSIVLNPSASKPEPALNKEILREYLTYAGADFLKRFPSSESNVVVNKTKKFNVLDKNSDHKGTNGGLYVYIANLGSDSAFGFYEGSQIFGQHTGETLDSVAIVKNTRYSVKNVSYSSLQTMVPTLAGVSNTEPTYEYGTLSTLVDHSFSNTSSENPNNPELSDFDRTYQQELISKDQLANEEYARTISLWLRDYLEKQTWPCQGYIISLSGGADSAYGAVMLAMMVELDVKGEGVEAFFERFKNLRFKDEVLKLYKDLKSDPARQEIAEQEAIKLIKKRMFTFIYLPTQNSGNITRTAAKTLIEGGKIKRKKADGTEEEITVDGIGGSFYIHNVQGAMEQYILTHGSFEMNKAIEESKEDPEVKKFFEETYRNNKDNFKEIFHAIMKGRITRHIINYMQNNAMNVDPITKKVKQSQYLPDYINRNYNGHIPTWSNKSDDLTLQNLQARVRLVVPWGIAVKEDKIALVTSNASEAALGYTTAGGDMHMGGVNPIGGIPKAAIQRSLLYFEEQGLVGLKPIPALYLINNQEPTAELRPNIVDEKGKIIAQTDESDLGFTYTQSEAMEHVLITQRNTPLEAFKILKDMQEKGSSKKLFNSDADVYSALVKFAVWRWPAAQFKRIMGTLAPFTGANFDPHATVRTTVFADHFRTGCALLGLELLQNSIDKDVYKNAKNAIPRSANLKGAFANSALFMPAEHNARSKLANELAAIPAW